MKEHGISLPYNFKIVSLTQDRIQVSFKVLCPGAIINDNKAVDIYNTI